MDAESELKAEGIDSIKDFIVAITVVPLWYLISGTTDAGFGEPVTIIVHYIVLSIVLWIVYNNDAFYNLLEEDGFNRFIEKSMNTIDELMGSLK